MWPLSISDTEISNEQCYTSTSPYAFMVCGRSQLSHHRSYPPPPTLRAMNCFRHSGLVASDAASIVGVSRRFKGTQVSSSLVVAGPPFLHMAFCLDPEHLRRRHYVLSKCRGTLTQRTHRVTYLKTRTSKTPGSCLGQISFSSIQIPVEQRTIAGRQAQRCVGRQQHTVSSEFDH
jgi:hypothetical protein